MDAREAVERTSPMQQFATATSGISGNSLILIFIKDFVGKTWTVKVAIDTSTETMEYKITCLTGIKLGAFYLTYRSKVLEHGHALRDYVISTDSTLFMCARVLSDRRINVTVDISALTATPEQRIVVTTLGATVHDVVGDFITGIRSGETLESYDLQLDGSRLDHWLTLHECGIRDDVTVKATQATRRQQHHKGKGKGKRERRSVRNRREGAALAWLAEWEQLG